ESAVRGLHVHDRAVDEAEAPTRLALNLARGAPSEIGRGALVTTDPAIGASRVLDVSLRLVAPVRPGAPLEAYVGTARSPARLRVLRAAPEATDAAPSSSDRSPSEAAPTLARVTLARPFGAGGDDRIVLRSTSPRGAAGAVVGGGRVLD